ncbi:hypothetical protein PHYPSEUDO_013963 [Phytophthora pseudosyringae]|uniref:RxLR effector protein n=1 Tax=Phytophthora pseudosyringae TaxID=221518 RepID=A0A8T1W721_9STRA|nr:hypothetical protein PHYPSEUDO_013963 [Phytophthora pseudosyringae]
MRLAYILVLAVAAIIHDNGTALSTTKDSKAMVENGDSTYADGGRMLRRVEKDPSSEERAVSFGKWMKNLNPMKVRRKFVHAGKVDKFVKAEAKRTAWLAEQAKKLSN